MLNCPIALMLPSGFSTPEVKGGRSSSTDKGLVNEPSNWSMKVLSLDSRELPKESLPTAVAGGGEAVAAKGSVDQGEGGCTCSCGEGMESTPLSSDPGGGSMKR